MELKQIQKFTVQLTRATHIDGEHYDSGDILDVEYKVLNQLRMCNAAIEIKDTKKKTK